MGASERILSSPRTLQLPCLLAQELLRRDGLVQVKLGDGDLPRKLHRVPVKRLALGAFLGEDRRRHLQAPALREGRAHVGAREVCATGTTSDGADTLPLQKCETLRKKSLIDERSYLDAPLCRWPCEER